MQGRQPKRNVELWGEEVYCSMCHKMKPKDDFYVKEKNGRKLYDSYCKKCRNLMRKRPINTVPVFSDEIPEDVKAREKYVTEHGLLRYPVAMLLSEVENTISVAEESNHAKKGIAEDMYIDDAGVDVRRTKPYIGNARVWKVQVVDGKELIHCRKCGQWLPRDAFYNYRTRVNPDACKECKKQMQKEYYYKKKGYVNNHFFGRL